MNTTLTLVSLVLATSLSKGIEQKNIPSSPKFIQKDEHTILLDVPFVNQINDLPESAKQLIKGSACGPASLTMAFNYYGQNLSLYEVIQKLPASVYVKGERFYQLQKGPDYFGFKSRSFKNSPQNIYNALEEGNPVILNLQNYDGITGHAVVVVGIKNYTDGRADSLIINDPFRERNMEFAYIDANHLKQPEGYVNSIGTLDPFYILPEKTNSVPNDLIPLS